MTITPIYAALLAFVFIYLSIRTIKLRRANKVSIGHGGIKQLERAMRAHANFAEYVPFSLLLMAMQESVTHLGMLTHTLGLTLLTGRIVHAYAISQVNEEVRYRVSGMLLTFAVIAISAAFILISLLIK